MKAVIKKVGENPEVKEYQKIKYEDLKEAVGGWIEAVSLDNGVTLWVNEEGKLIGLKNNFALGNMSIEGNVIFTSVDDEGETIGLTDDQIDYIKSLFKNKKPTAYQKYIDMFFEEKDLPIEHWTFTGEHEGMSVIQVYDSRTIIAYLRNISDPFSQSSVMKVLSVLDFHDGDINDFLKYVANGLAEGVI